jgi:hypothetical protein
MADQRAYDRFIASMTITQEMWHDGIGYETDALSETTREELGALVQRMKECGDWRHVEALAAIAAMDDPKVADSAKAALKARAKSNDKIGLRAAEALSELGEKVDLEDSIVKTLLKMKNDDAFSQALDLSEGYPTPRVKMTLLQCAKEHHGMGVHCAAMLYFHAGLAKEAFDWNHLPFFLRFGDDDEEDRARAFKELCAKTGLSL